MSLEEILSNLQKQSKLPQEKIDAMIDDKCIEFSGMITKEAAAHLVARELGLSLPRSDSTKLQIKNIVSGMRNINVIGRVFKISPINEFQKKNGDKGRVVNIFISDGTGYTRVPLWNDQVKIVEDEIIKTGDAVQVFGGFSKDNIYDEVEISVGKFGGLRKVEDDYLAPSMELISKSFVSENRRVDISDLIPGNFEVKGTVTQVFRGKFIFENETGEKSIVISVSIDDGSGEIRAVLFRELAEKVSGVSVKDLENLDPDQRQELVKQKMIGKDLIILGKVKNNQFFQKLEIVADQIKDLNVLDESKRIAEEIETKLSG